MFRTQSTHAKWMAALMLVALTVPAFASASVQACITACASGYRTAESGCAMAPREHSAVADSSSCCKKSEPPRRAMRDTPHTRDGCSCATCSLASARLLETPASIKMPTMAKLAVLSEIFNAPTYAPAARANAARFVHIRTGPTRALLCVYLR